MRLRPMSVIAIILFIASFVMSVVGPWTRGMTNVYLSVSAVWTLIMGWIFHIISFVKK